MKEFFMTAWRSIVGKEYGWTGKGCSQWYYTLALIICIMLSWCIGPGIGLIFTFAAVLHYITVYAYGKMGSKNIKRSTIIYYGIHLAIFLVCLVCSLSWTILTTAIVVIFYVLAPDDKGNNIILKEQSKRNKYTLLYFHSAVFLVFLIVSSCLPIPGLLRLLIIVAVIILHLLIDTYYPKYAFIDEVTRSSFKKLKEIFKK